jgi:lysophospholipid acyltransferase (LPLAT)-like uncharacterized protein
MLKKALRSPFGQRVASYLIANIIRLTARSTRWTIINPEIGDKFMSGKPTIGIFWHERIMLMTEAWRSDGNFWMLQSPHRDGALIARAIQKLGFHTIWGSSSIDKGGAASLRTMVKTLKQGDSVGITPDGPRGPSRKLSPGVIAAARLSGCSVYPLAWSVSNKKRLSTWDRMVIARPFSKGVIAYGEPIHVPRSLTKEEQEQYRQLIEQRLNEVTEEADKYIDSKSISGFAKKSY